MKNQLNRELIESLGESGNTKFLERVNDLISGLISQSVLDISEMSAFVRMDKCVFLPVNEIYTGAISQLSTYDYFLGVENPQIEFNSKTKKNFWKFVWREFKAAWRLGKKKYKKMKKEEVRSVENIEKYKLSDFRHDIVRTMANYLSGTTVIYEHMQYISVVGMNDFGTNVKINIYIGTYNSAENTFKLYNEVKNKFTVINFGDRYKNLDFKAEACGETFVKILRILNAMYSKNYNRIPNQILMESLVWNCPNSLFVKGDVYKTFVNVSNFIRLSDPKSIVSICNVSKNIFEESLILGSNSQIEFSKIINMLDRFAY